MTDSKYFTTTKKGEIFELKNELNSDKKEKKREAVKKVIASMTVGKDVSALFPDVVNCMQTDNVELKKLVYLYLMNYAKSHPDLAILAVNTFVKDCEDPNPLIRALAVRTMGCIRVDKITEYLCEPLRKCMKDEDPYVRKTAAVCVAKLHDINPSLVEDQGFVELLSDLLSDSNPMVVANAVASITEINQTKPLFEINLQLVNKLLTALNECTEWGQVFILDALNNYTPRDEREAQNICERISPRLAHANAAVVLSTVKVLMKLMNYLPENSEFINQLTKKLAPPMITLLSAEPEIQYVALRNINLIVQKRPDILKQEMKVFFVKYNDPIYVKMEKLDIMIRLAQQSNIAQVLSELKEYAAEVDVDFVRKAVRAIGRCAIKIETAAEKCVSTLLELLQTKVNYVVQEAVVVIKDIFRKYPNKYEGIISTLCENLDTLDEPEARASMIWIIGEYAERIENADELLESFVETFHDESTQVQLQLLTATVKLFLKKPSESQDLVQRVLALATQDSDNPDLRDRGYIYWRLLSADPAAAKEVVLASKPLISGETDFLEPSFLNQLINHIGTLASVYHKPPSSFIDTSRQPLKKLGVPSSESNDETGDILSFGNGGAPMRTGPVIPSQDNIIVDLLSLDINPTPANPPQNSVPTTSGLDDLLGLGNLSINNINPPSTTSQPATNDLLSDILGSSTIPTMQTQPPSTFGGVDIFGTSTMNTLNTFGGFDVQSSPSPYMAPKSLWLDSNAGKGLEVLGTFVRRNGEIYMEMTFTNKSLIPLTNFALQMNRNSFGIVPAVPLYVPSPLQPNQSENVTLQCKVGGGVLKMDPLTNIQVAIKSDNGILYFSCIAPLNIYFVESGKLEKAEYLQKWKDIAQTNEVTKQLSNTKLLSCDDICKKLEANNAFVTARRQDNDKDILYISIKYTNNVNVLCEMTVQQGSPTITLLMKALFAPALSTLDQCLQEIIDN
uniref:AP complex subunit beta n=1 Tax=Strongyloides venezuelensis TaxID=75913 RepID=A0A0K0FUB9_STRVS